jgi:hypothetical protein
MNIESRVFFSPVIAVASIEVLVVGKKREPSFADCTFEMGPLMSLVGSQRLFNDMSDNHLLGCMRFDNFGIYWRLI